MALSKEQQHLVDLQYFRLNVIKPFYEVYEQAVQDVIAKHGMDQELRPSEDEVKLVHQFQDENGICYQIEPCRGRYVVFSPYEVSNTRTYGEEKGLAAKHSVSLGFTPQVDEVMAASKNAFQKVLDELIVTKEED
jgi:hypothetical protein